MRTSYCSSTVESWVGLCWMKLFKIVQTPRHEQDTQAVQSPVQTYFEHFWWWDIHNLFGQLVPVSQHSRNKIIITRSFLLSYLTPLTITNCKSCHYCVWHLTRVIQFGFQIVWSWSSSLLVHTWREQLMLTGGVQDLFQFPVVLFLNFCLFYFSSHLFCFLPFVTVSYHLLSSHLS